MKTTPRYPLLDFYRGVAIGCVVADHALVWWGLAGTGLQKYLIFSVAPLFFLAGVTTALSLSRRAPLVSWRPWRVDWLAYGRYLARALAKILIPYIIAMLIILIYRGNFVNLSNFLHQLLLFPDQFYFILIYLQLIALGPWLDALARYLVATLSGRLTAGNVVFVVLVLAIVAVLAQAVGRITIGDPATFAPARQLGGGIELWVFTLGAFAWRLYQRRGEWREQLQLPGGWLARPGLLAAGGALGLVFLVISGGIDQIFRHPPGFLTLIYCVSVALILAELYRAVWRSGSRALAPVIACGRDSLSIFLYHALWLEIIVTHWPVVPGWRWLQCGVAALVAIGASLLTGRVLAGLAILLTSWRQKGKRE